MASVSIKCIHPYKRVRSEFSEPDYEGSEYCCFIWCMDCKKVLEWNGNTKPREIPIAWPKRVRFLARKLTGYKFERDSASCIQLPISPQEAANSATLTDMLNIMYDKDYIEKLELFRKLYGGK